MVWKNGIIIVPFSFFYASIKVRSSNKKKKKNLTSEKVRFNVNVELNSNLTVVLIIKLFYAFTFFRHGWQFYNWQITTTHSRVLINARSLSPWLIIFLRSFSDLHFIFHSGTNSMNHACVSNNSFAKKFLR